MTTPRSLVQLIAECSHTQRALLYRAQYDLDHGDGDHAEWCTLKYEALSTIIADCRAELARQRPQEAIL